MEMPHGRRPGKKVVCAPYLRHLPPGFCRAAMTGRLTVIALLALASSSQAADRSLPAIPPDLALAATSGSHRLLAFQECSEENCWHRFQIQVISLNPHRKVLCSKALSELNRHENTMVRDVQWRATPAPVLELTLHSAQDEFAPYVAALSFSGNCKYKLYPPSPPPLDGPPAAAPSVP